MIARSMMGKVEVSACSAASPATVYRALKESGVLSGSQVVGGVPCERVDMEKPPSVFVAEHFGRIELLELADGRTLVRWRIVFRARFPGVDRLVRSVLRHSTLSLARRIARFAAARDYDVPPY